MQIHFFMKPTSFIKNNKCLYNYGHEYNKLYFKHMVKLDKDLIKVDKNKSGISHHMMFETKYIQLLFNKIEDAHNDTFYNVFLKNVSSEDILKSGASEYELYFNFMLKYYNNEIIIRELQWKNTNSLDNKDNNNYHYISYHWYMRK